MGGLSAQSVSILGYIEPLSAIVLGAVVLGETMAPLQIAGALCIVVGAIASEQHVETLARMTPSFTRHAHKRA